MYKHILSIPIFTYTIFSNYATAVTLVLTIRHTEREQQNPKYEYMVNTKSYRYERWRLFLVYSLILSTIEHHYYMCI